MQRQSVNTTLMLLHLSEPQRHHRLNAKHLQGTLPTTKNAVALNLLIFMMNSQGIGLLVIRQIRKIPWIGGSYTKMIILY